MRSTLLPLVLLLIGFTAQAQPARPVYSKATVALDKAHTMRHLAALGVEVDHGQTTRTSFTTVFSEQELARIRAAGFGVSVTVPDAAADFERRNAAARQRMAAARVDDIDPGCDNLGTWPQPRNWSYGSMGGHLTYEEVMAHLDSMHAKYPALITARAAVDTVRTLEGRPLHWLRMNGHAATANPGQPEILFTAVHHAREPVGIHQLIWFMWDMLERYGHDDEITRLIDSTQIYLIPIVNPDGYVYNHTTNPNGGGFWRKNRRDNLDGTYGVDPNRNYGSTNWGIDDVGSSPDGVSETYRGVSAFSEAETRAVRNFCRGHRFGLCLNYHTYSDVLIHPYGHIDQPPPDSSTYRNLGHEITRESHYANGTCYETLFYFTNGGSDDYMYEVEAQKPKIFAMTPEVGQEFWPTIDQIIPQCRRAQYQNRAALRAAHAFGVFTDSTGLFLRPGFGANAGPQRLRYKLKHIGARDQAANFAVTLTPIGPGHASTSPIVSLYTLARDHSLTDSVLIPEGAVGSPNGRRLAWQVSVDNGAYITLDTLYHYDGIPQSGANLADGCETTTGWEGGWVSDNRQPPSGRGYFSDSPGYEPTDSSGQYVIVNNPFRRTRSFDLRTLPAVAAELSFLTRYQMDRFYDAAALELSTDSGQSWTTTCADDPRFASVKHQQGALLGYDITDTPPIYAGAKPFWSRAWANLAPYLRVAGGQAGSKVWMRINRGTGPFTLGYDGFYLDDIRIRYVQAGVVTADAPALANSLRVQPNPFTQTLQVAVSGSSPIRLYDALGRPVATPLSQQREGMVELDTRALPAGIYMLRQGGNVRRVVKQ